MHFSIWLCRADMLHLFLSFWVSLSNFLPFSLPHLSPSLTHALSHCISLSFTHKLFFALSVCRMWLGTIWLWYCLTVLDRSDTYCILCPSIIDYSPCNDPSLSCSSVCLSLSHAHTHEHYLSASLFFSHPFYHWHTQLFSHTHSFQISLSMAQSHLLAHILLFLPHTNHLHILFLFIHRLTAITLTRSDQHWHHSHLIWHSVYWLCCFLSQYCPTSFLPGNIYSILLNIFLNLIEGTFFASLCCLYCTHARTYTPHTHKHSHAHTSLFLTVPASSLLFLFLFPFPFSHFYTHMEPTLPLSLTRTLSISLALTHSLSLSNHYLLSTV